MTRLMTFRLADEYFALPAEAVSEVIEGAVIKPAPCPGEQLAGITRVRGRWIPVIDLVPWDGPVEAAGSRRRRGRWTVIVLGAARGWLGIRVREFGEVLEAEVSRLSGGEGLIDIDGALVRYVDPALVVSSYSQESVHGGNVMNGETTTEPIKLVTMTIGKERFGVDVMSVRRVLQLPEVNRVPNAPEFVEGVAEVPDGVAPVIDMRKRFTVETNGSSAATRLLVVQIDGASVGLVVDSVPGVVSFDPDDVNPPPEFFKGIAGRYLQGIARRDDKVFIVLDLAEVLSSTEKIELKEMVEGMSDDGPEKKRVSSKNRTTKKPGKRRKRKSD